MYVNIETPLSKASVDVFAFAAENQSSWYSIYATKHKTKTLQLLRAHMDYMDLVGRYPGKAVRLNHSLIRNCLMHVPK